MSTSTASLALPPVASTSRIRTAGLALAVASALAFSSSGPVVKPLLDEGWSLGAALLIRMGISGLLLSPALIIAIVRERAFLRRHGLLILGFGLTAVAGCQLLFFSAMQRMPVAIALLIQYLAPVLLVGLAWVRTRRAPSRLVLIGSAVAVIGLVLVVDIAGAHFDLIGTLLALGAAVCVGAYFLISERAGDDLPPLALAAGGLLTGAVVMAVLCVTGILPFAAPAVDVVLGGMVLPVVGADAVGRRRRDDDRLRLRRHGRAADRIAGGVVRRALGSAVRARLRLAAAGRGARADPVRRRRAHPGRRRARASRCRHRGNGGEAYSSCCANSMSGVTR